MIAATPEDVRNITQQVLSRPEFLERPTWTQLVFDRVSRWLRALADWSSRNPDLAKMLIILLSIVLALLLIHIVYTVVREFVSLRKDENGGSRRRSLRALEGVAENWNDAFHLARAALDAGDLYRAMWVTHRILLSVLDRMGRIKFVRWKTNTDYLRECNDTGAPATVLSEVTAAYEQVVYAHSELDRQRAVKLLAEVESLAAGAGQ
jgi:hypothetical protein